MLVAIMFLFAVGLALTSYQLDRQITINYNNSRVTDSLKEEIYLLQMNVDKQIFIINQISEIHPNLVDSIINDTE